MFTDLNKKADSLTKEYTGVYRIIKKALWTNEKFLSYYGALQPLKKKDRSKLILFLLDIVDNNLTDKMAWLTGSMSSWDEIAIQYVAIRELFQVKLDEPKSTEEMTRHLVDLVSGEKEREGYEELSDQLLMFTYLEQAPEKGYTKENIEFSLDNLLGRRNYGKI